MTYQDELLEKCGAHIRQILDLPVGPDKERRSRIAAAYCAAVMLDALDPSGPARTAIIDAVQASFAVGDGEMTKEEFEAVELRVTRDIFSRTSGGMTIKLVDNIPLMLFTEYAPTALRMLFGRMKEIQPGADRLHRLERDLRPLCPSSGTP